MKIIKSIINWFVFLFTCKGPIANEMVDKNLLDLSGQGRDKYGN